MLDAGCWMLDALDGWEVLGGSVCRRGAERQREQRMSSMRLPQGSHELRTQKSRESGLEVEREG
jgi:hypothetical protein